MTMNESIIILQGSSTNDKLVVALKLDFFFFFFFEMLKVRHFNQLLLTFK